MQPGFISHASKNFRLADEVRGGLEALSLACWIAPRNIPLGSSYGEEIAKAIGGCAAVLLVLTEEANVSKAVANELELAFRNQKVIIPLRLRPIEPANQLAFFISNSQWVDAFHTPLKIRVAHIAELVRAIAAGNPSLPIPQERKSLLNTVDRYLEDILRYKYIVAVCSIIVVLAIASTAAVKTNNTATALDKERTAIELDSSTFGLVTVQEKVQIDEASVGNDNHQFTVNLYQNISDPSKADIKWEAFGFSSDGYKHKISLPGLREFKSQDVQSIELSVPKSANQLTFCMTAIHPTINKEFTARWDFNISKPDAKSSNVSVSRNGQSILEPSERVGCYNFKK